MSELPPTSLIISSRNRHALLREAVRSVLSADELPNEVIIVDQSDTPDELLAQTTHAACDVRYIWTRSVGVSLGRNLGVAKAKHAIIAVIDDDMRVTPTWFGALIRALVQAGPGAAVTGRVVAGAAEEEHGFVLAVHAWDQPSIYAGRIGRDILATGHMAMYRSLFQELGGLDERLGPGTRFPGAEDNDLGFRLLEAGGAIVYVPDSVIYHRAWRSRSQYVPLQWRYGRGQGAFYAKHLKLHDWYMLGRLRRDAVHHLRQVGWRIRQRRIRQLAGSMAWLMGTFVGGTEWLVLNAIAPP